MRPCAASVWMVVSFLLSCTDPGDGYRRESLTDEPEDAALENCTELTAAYGTISDSIFSKRDSNCWKITVPPGYYLNISMESFSTFKGCPHSKVEIDIEDEDFVHIFCHGQEKNWRHIMAFDDVTITHETNYFKNVFSEISIKYQRENFRCAAKNIYKCYDGECIPESLVCDEIKQCDNGRDEEECGPCFGEPCRNGGTCKVENNSFKCYCPTSFSGRNCETDPCSVEPCKNGGTCKVENNSFKCYCPTPFSGRNCDADPCFSSPCLNGGTCKIKGSTYSCDCPKDYIGEKCQHFCDCKNGKCRVTSDNDVVCECLPEYGKKSDVCEACDCGTGANCTWESGWLTDTKYCLCPDGSRLRTHCEDPCSDNPCKNGGTCRTEKSSFKCDCLEPFFGNTCEEGITISTVMTSTVSSSLRTTLFPSTTVDMCNNDLCIHGKCELIEQYYRCRCDEGFTGFFCEHKVQTISDKQFVWLFIQTLILFSILILISWIFCLHLRRKK